MKKIALISSGFLPVPAVNGGGVEQLCETFIEQNDKYCDFCIDLYTIYDEKINKYNYKNTKVISIKKNKLCSILDATLNYILKKMNICLYFDNYIKKVANIVATNNDYEYIIIENNMFLFQKINKTIKTNNIKLIFHLHNDIDNYYKPIKLSKYISKNAYAIITVSQYIKKRFVSLTGCDERKVHCVYNCVDLPPKLIKDNDEHVDSGITTFLYCGRFSPEKGLKELILAFNRLKNTNAKLIVLGGPVYKKMFGMKILNSYSKKIYKLSSNNKSINFTGYVNNKLIYEYYKIADVVVIPTICEEAFGLVAVEAMRCSKAIIVTNSGGLTEIINEKCAIIINKSNIIDELEKAMAELIGNKKKINELGENSYNLVKKLYKPENYYYGILKVLKEKGD